MWEDQEEASRVPAHIKQISFSVIDGIHPTLLSLFENENSYYHLCVRFLTANRKGTWRIDETLFWVGGLVGWIVS